MKDSQGNVAKSDWLVLMNTKYKAVLVGRQVARYNTFLGNLYDAAVAMQVPAHTTLKQHAFKYAAVVASEFYWYK